MVWKANLGGNTSPEEERKIAADLARVAADHNVGVAFWTSNEPIDLDSFVETETEAVNSNAPAKKAK